MNSFHYISKRYWEGQFYLPAQSAFLAAPLTADSSCSFFEPSKNSKLLTPNSQLLTPNS